MKSRDGRGRGRRAMRDGSERRRISDSPVTWALAILALVSMAPLIALTFPDLSTVAAAAPPVARDDVARTNSDASVSSFVIGNDFDPDGDSFSIVAVATPPNGTVSNGGSSIVYTPNPGFSGRETINYTIQDSTGLTDDAVLTVWVDSGVLGSGDPGGQHRLPVRLSRRLGGDHHRRSVGQRQRPARPSRSASSRSPNPATTASSPEPSTSASPTHPASTPALVNTDHTLNYLVTDTDGHVDRRRHHHPHPRRRRHQPTTGRSR